MTATRPWEPGNDRRRMTDLPTGPYLEAAKVWGGCMEGRAGDDHTWAFESFLAALRVYEFERSRAPGQHAVTDAGESTNPR